MTKDVINVYGAQEKFGRLMPIATFEQTGDRRPKFLCVCDCGKLKAIQVNHLREGATKSCGCLHKDFIRHGHARTKQSGEWLSWSGMRQRCANPNKDSYEHYGGRGISVCSRWNESFEKFLADMGPKPSPEYSIERKDTDGNYEPGNCKWATRSEQMGNRRPYKLKYPRKRKMACLPA